MNTKLLIPAAVIAAAGIGLAGCGPVKSAPAHTTPIPGASAVLTPATSPAATQTTTPPAATTAPVASTATPTPTTAATAPTVASPASPGEGPGALNPAVTQQTIHSTICISGWTGTVRPPESYTYEVKKAQLAARGIYSVRGYQEDHVIALEIGGAPWNPVNLRPITTAQNEAKGVQEDRLRREVCDGQITLAQARTADHSLGVK